MNAEYNRDMAKAEQDLITARAKAALDSIYAQKTVTLQQMPPRASKTWGSQFGDKAMSETPSLERIFTCIGSLQTELDDLSAKDWGAFNPKRTVVWWKRMPLMRKIDWFVSIPAVALMIAFVGYLMYQLYEVHWFAGAVVTYALLMAFYITWRHQE
jgi:hypothetical protein